MVQGPRYIGSLSAAILAIVASWIKIFSYFFPSAVHNPHAEKMHKTVKSSAIGRNHSLAIDLESLPLELIEEVLKDLNFEQAIRLSSWAGPQLIRAFEISPSWKQHFGSEDIRAIWQKYLQLTDQINVLCFDTRRDARTWFKEPHFHWYSRDDSNRKCIIFLQDGPSSSLDVNPRLRTRWLEAMSSALEVGASFFGDASFGDLRTDLPQEQRSASLKDSRDTKSTKEGDIENAVRLYKGALSARRSSLVGELRRLATLYEAHPRLLKLPYAPQWSNPNVHHIPRQLRARANKMDKAPLSFHANAGGRTYFHNDFAALVPFDWTVRFLVSILGDEQETNEKFRFLLDDLARYYLHKAEPGGQQNIYAAGIPWSLSLLKPRQIGFLAGAAGPEWIRDEGPLTAHVDDEVDWLEGFVEGVAELIKKYPEAAQEARAEEGDLIRMIDQLSKLHLA